MEEKIYQKKEMLKNCCHKGKLKTGCTIIFMIGLIFFYFEESLHFRAQINQTLGKKIIQLR